MPDPVLLIHGAWQGSWTWSRLVPLLEARGLEALALDLPGNGYDDVQPEAVSIDLYLDHIATVIEGLPGKVSIIGHSGGGVVATAAAERFAERVSRVGYVAGMMLPAGMGFADLQRGVSGPDSPPTGITGHLIWSDDRLTNWAPVEKALEIFYHDCEPAIAQDAVSRLRPQPFGGFAIISHQTEARFGRLPRLYVEATGDRSVLIEEQRRMQALAPGAEVLTLRTGHVPQLSAPGQLADALCPFLLREFAGEPSPTA